MNNDTEKINSILNEIKSRSVINFPKYEFPSLEENDLIIAKTNSKIMFITGEYYDTISKTISFNNGAIFEGNIKNEDNKYFLEQGKYTWPSGQTFEGIFNENKMLEGELKFEENIYKGKFNNEVFEGEGEFKFNKKNYVKGEFKNGEINGYACVEKGSFVIYGNFVESKANGKIDICNLNINNHIYELENINLENNEIKEDNIEIKKDGKKLSYIKKLDDLITDKNLKEIDADEKLIVKLRESLNLLNIKVPVFQLPNIKEEGLVQIEENYPIIRFKNGEEANVDEDNEENELTIRNGEKFIGRLDLKEGKCYMKEGKYIWPSGLIYEGKFNENNKFETSVEDSKLYFKNKWSYKGKFKDGKFQDKGTIIWENGKKLIAYFEDNNIKGHSKIKYKDYEIEADIKNNLITGIKVYIDGKIYKIKKIDLNNNKKETLVVTIGDEKNDTNNFFINYRFNNNIEIEKITKITKEELDKILSMLETKILFPSFEQISLKEDSLIMEKENKILFQKDIYYNKDDETLYLPNKEYFKGNLDNSNDKYYLSIGEYNWPSGQKYIGKFNDEYNFHSDEEKSTLITKDFTYEGGFKYGLPDGDGEIKWNNGDIIKGKFIKGNLFGNVYVKTNNINFEGNYIYSIIDGPIKNIHMNNDEKLLWNNQFTVIEGKIQEPKIMYNEKEIELTEENRCIVSEADLKRIEFDEEDIILLFKFICKIRKLSLPSYEQPRVSEDGIYIPISNNLQNVKLAFPNDETFEGQVQKISGTKYMLIKGDYCWTNNQKYKGKFEKNRFCDENAELIYPDNCKYTGGFKNGLFEGYGKFVNQRNDIYEGNFKEGQIKNSIKINTKNFSFEGSNLDLINDLYIKLFSIRTSEHFYKISEFNINNNNIIYNRDGIEFKIGMTKEIKQKIIESLIIRNKTIMKNFYYNNPYMRDLANENTLKSLKIEDNIYSGKLTKLTIYKNRLLDENKNKKKEAKRIFGDLNKKMVLMNKDEKLNFLRTTGTKFKNNYNNKNQTKSLNFGEIEKKEISRIFNRKMLKEMEKENELLKQDIATLKMEKDLIEKEKYNRIKELKDLHLYFELIGNNYNDLMKECNKKDIEVNEMQNELKQIYQENNLLSKYLKKKPKTNINEEIEKNIKEFENSNNKILNEISEKEKIINEQNKEKNELLEQIRKLENKN